MSEELLLKSVQLAREGQQEQAYQLVEEYTRQNPFDARGWWVMANVLEDTTIKKVALNHVLELKPDNAKARAMLAELEIDAVFSMADLPPQTQSALRKPTRLKIYIRPADLLLVGGALLIVGILVLVAGWYAYAYQHSGIFGLFGPDLSKEASTDQYSIHYPEDWDGKIINFQAQAQKVTVAANYEIDAIVSLLANQPSADAAISALTGNEPFGLNSSIMNQSASNLSEEEFAELLRSFAILIFAPVSQEQLDLIQIRFQGQTTSMESLDYFGVTVETKAETTEIEIDSDDGELMSFSLSLNFPEEFTEISTFPANEINISSYLATTHHTGQAYLLFMVVLEESPGDQARTVRRIIRSIQFK